MNKEMTKAKGASKTCLETLNKGNLLKYIGVDGGGGG
jgi:hypothetical protein